ncbi:MAG: hypothetical protein ABI425_01010 [Patescibacteria group bacterium]
MSHLSTFISKNNKVIAVFSVLISIFLVATRFWQLSAFPAALTHDEVVYAVQAQSFSIQGTTLNQQFHWWSLQPVHSDYAEFPALLMAPFFKLISNPLLATRAISVFMGVTFPFILSAFSYGLWKNKKLSFFVFLVSCFNPLLWQMSRLTYDAVMSTYFYSIGGTIVLLWKGKKSLYSLLFFTLGFFCYQGYKLVFIPWVLLLGALQFTSIKQVISQRYYLFILGFCTALFLGYILLILPNQKIDNRWNNTIFANKDFQAKNSNEDRRMAIVSPLAPVFSNKVVVIFKFLGERFINAYAPTRLFINGEPAQSTFSAWGYGWFHYFEIVLLLIGLFFTLTVKKIRISVILLLSFMVIATIPATINSGEPWFLLRMFLPCTLLILFIAWGNYFLFTRFVWGKYLIICLYSIGAVSFSYHYYYRYPILGLNVSYFSERVMSEYVARSLQANPGKKIIVYTIDPPVMFWTYLLYSHGITRSTVDSIAQIENTQSYVLGDVTFSSNCVDLADEDTIILSEANRSAVPCDHDQTHFPQSSKDDFQKLVSDKQKSAITIPSVIDNGAYWRIYNNLLCDQKTMQGYITVNTFANLDPTAKNDQDFCQTYISTVH